jgi:hypothetical protein
VGDVLECFDATPWTDIAFSNCVEQSGNDQVPWLVHFFDGPYVRWPEKIAENLRGRQGEVAIGVGFIMLDFSLDGRVLFLGSELHFEVSTCATLPARPRLVYDYLVNNERMLQTPGLACIPKDLD